MFSMGAYYNSINDSDSAFRFYLDGAKLGNVSCQLNLGVMYDEGKGVDKSVGLSLFWFEKAAKNGDTDANFNVGIMYEHGEGVEPDISKAMKYYCDSGEYNLCDRIESIQIIPEEDTVCDCEGWEVPESDNLLDFVTNKLQTI